MNQSPDDVNKLRRLIDPGMTLAELASTDCTHIHTTCPSCEKTIQVPFMLMPSEHLAMTFEDYAKRLRCKKCDVEPGIVAPWQITYGYPGNQQLAEAVLREFKRRG